MSRERGCSHGDTGVSIVRMVLSESKAPQPGQKRGSESRWTQVGVQYWTARLGSLSLPGQPRSCCLHSMPDTACSPTRREQRNPESHSWSCNGESPNTGLVHLYLHISLTGWEFGGRPEVPVTFRLELPTGPPSTLVSPWPLLRALQNFSPDWEPTCLLPISL